MEDDDYYDFMNRDLLKICNKSIQIHGLNKKKKFMSFLFPEWTSGDLTFHYTHSEGKIWWVNPGNPDKWYEVSNGNLINQLNAMTDERGKRDRQEKRDDAAIFKETLKQMSEYQVRQPGKTESRGPG